MVRFLGPGIIVNVVVDGHRPPLCFSIFPSVKTCGAKAAQISALKGYSLDNLNHLNGAKIIRTDFGRFSFVNRTTAKWNQLHEGAIGTSPTKTHTFRRRVRKVKIREVK
jgi:hypothetical protein